jgi:hypothetical protein
MNLANIRLQLIDDWKHVAPRLWSVRLSLIAAAASSAQAGFEYFIAGQKPYIAVAAALFSFGSAASRIVAQPGLFEDGHQ